MSKFIINPNLPENRVEKVIIGNHKKIIGLLEKHGIEAIILKDNQSVDYSVRNHADMACCYLGEGRIILDKLQTEATEILKRSGMTVFLTESNISGKYPDDIQLNSAVFGCNLICLPKATNSIVLEENKDKRLFSVKQGYCKCSVCPVSENAFITDDAGIYNKTKDYLDVLLVEKGDILLEGKDYGFIGGASAKIEKTTMLFFGNINTHRNADKILEFLEKYGVRYKNLFDGQLVDIGGIVAITEK